MPTGGPRTAKPGATYGNRSDLTASADATYGDNVNQQAIRSSTPNRAPVRGGGGGPPPPGSLIPLSAPSTRPNEPVTAGLPVGPGDGPEALAPMPPMGDDSLYELRALAARFPSKDLDRIIAMAESEL